MKFFDEMEFGKQSRNKTVQSEQGIHYGFDTETLNGKLHLITYAGNGKVGYLYINVNKPDKTIYDILKFMTERKFLNALNWFYNLDYDVRAILRWLPENNISALYHKHETKIGGYKLSFLSKKFFAITYKKHTYTFYDIAQFYPGGLDANAKKYLGKEKIDNIDASILGSNKKYWVDNLNDVITYCVYDSLLTGMLADLLYSNMWRILKFNPKKPFSCGSISQEFFINNCEFIPTIQGIPEEILRIHQNNYRGGRIEIMKKGVFHNVYSFDISSAYPAEMVKLLDYSCGRWWSTTDFDDNIHGIYKVKFNWFNEDLGFIAFSIDKKTVYPNCHECISWMNENELKLLSNNPKFADFEILEGWKFIPQREVYPYRELIEKFYELKQGAEDKNERMLYKLYINSIYGKTAQAIYDKNKKKYVTGKLYNPLYSCRITANTRIKLLEYSLRISKDVIGFSTDSIQTTNKHVKTGGGLGDFELEYIADEGVVLMAGLRYMDHQQKMRGFGSKRIIINDEDIEERVMLNLKEVLEEYSDKTLIPIKMERPITIFQGLNYKKYSKTDINVFKSEDRFLDINGDNRRLWSDDFKNAADVFTRNINSTPFFVEQEENR